MIRTEDALNIPDVLWTGVSQFERLAVPKDYEDLLIKRSSPAKIFLEEDRTLLIAGVYQESFLGPRRFWALVSPELSKAKASSLRALKHYGDEVLPGAETYILKDDSGVARLAKFFGFIPTEQYTDFDNKVYEVYRRPA